MKCKPLFLLVFIFFLFDYQKVTAQENLVSINELIQKTQYNQALILLEKLNISDSTQAEILQKQAYCNFKLGRFVQAKKWYQLLLIKNPDSQEINYQLAVIADKESNGQKSYLFYQKLTKLDSLNTFYWKELSRTCVRTGRRKEGISYLKKAIILDSLDLESITDLANIYMNDGTYELSDPLIDRAMKLDSSSIKVRHLRSRTFYIDSDFQQVRKEILFTMAQGDTTAYYQRLLGTAFYHMDSTAQSIAVFKRLLRVGEKSENVYAGLAFAQLASTENDDKILFEADKNFYEAQDLGTSERLTDYELGHADILDKLGDTDEAIKILLKLIEQRPKAVLRLGQIYEKKKKDKELALLYYQEYIKACKRLKKPSPDTKYIDLAMKKIKELNPSLKIEVPKIQTTLADSTVMEKDTSRNDEK
jgi:tetratricopeptide (TPR) repeat protein